MLRTMSAESVDGSPVDDELLDSHIKLINKRRLQMEEERRNLSIVNMSRTVELDDGTVLYIKANEYTSHVHAVLPVPVHVYDKFDEEEEKKIIERGIPDYVSGAVLSPIINVLERTYVDENGEEVTEEYDSLANVKLCDERFTVDLAKEKLALDESLTFEEFQGSGDPKRYSQHRAIKPALYTGYMRTVVQLLLGVGKVFQDTYERQYFDLIPTDPIEEQGGEEPVLSPFGLYDEVPQQDRIQVLYDYRFHKTHGISWGPDGAAYVVEVSTRGVHVMPLELEPISVTPEGRAQYEKVYPELAEPDDRTGEIFLEKIGGFPMGTCMPAFTGEFNSMVRAGVIVRALSSTEMSPFYDKYFYSSGIGWSFSANGWEAINTCYSMDPITGLQKGYYYGVGISIGPKVAIEDESPGLTGEISALLPAETPKYLRDKVARLTEAQKRAILREENVVEALDDATVPGVVAASAQLGLRKSGFLFHPAIHTPEESYRFSPQPQFKVAEPFFPGAPSVSFDWRNVEDLSSITYPRCDTPIYVFHVGNSTRVINYFWRPEKPIVQETYSTEEECQVIGSFETGTRRQGEYAMGHFYSNDFDPRKLVELHSTKTKHTRRILGETYYSGFCAIWASHSRTITEVFGDQYSEGTKLEFHTADTAISIPYGDRSVYFVGTFERKTGLQEFSSNSSVYKVGEGPYVRHGQVYHWLFHWAGHCKQFPIWQPPAPMTCVLVEYKAPTTQQTCLESASMPPFPDYSMCIDRKGVGYSQSFTRGTIPPSAPSYEITPVSNLVKYSIHVYGDVLINGDRIAYEEMADEPFAGPTGGPGVLMFDNPWHPFYYPAFNPSFPGGIYGIPSIRLDFYSTTMNPWWFLPSPTINGMMAYHRVNQCEFGHDILAYEPQFDANVKHIGGTEDMHVGVLSTFIGHVGPHPIPSV